MSIESTTGGQETNEKIVENSYTDPITGKFTKGNPGKPLGAKKKKKLVDLIAEAVEEKLKAEGRQGDAVMEIAKVIAEKILSGDINLMKEYWQQKDGKPKQPLVGGDKDDKPISILSHASLQRNNSNPEDSEA